MKGHAFFPILSSSSPNFALISMYTSRTIPSMFLILHPFQFNILNVINNLNGRINHRFKILSDIANTELALTHPVRLGLALNVYFLL
ncbi:hypothetical protein Hanom_Chr02g00157301 [Helianthus anomalus]